MTITVSPSGGDDTAAIQAAINSLPSRGGEVLLLAGTYNISGTGLRVGDGRSGVRLRGDGTAGILTENATPAVLLNWTGATGTILTIAGPLAGWGVENIAFRGNDKAWGLVVEGAYFGDCANLQFIYCPRAISGSQAAGKNAMHNTFRNVGIWMPAVVGAIGICLSGERLNGVGGANCCFWNFYNTLIAMPTGVLSYGLYLQQTDTNLFVGTHICNGAGGGVAINFDYGQGYDQPGACSFVGLDVGGPTVQFQTSGTPAAGVNPNHWVKAQNAGNGNVAPTAFGVLGDGDLAVNGKMVLRGHLPITGEAGMVLLVNKSGTPTMVQVKVGAAGSGGQGKRALVIDN